MARGCDDIELLVELELYQGLLEIMCPYGCEITEVTRVVGVRNICTIDLDVCRLLIRRCGVYCDRRGGGFWSRLRCISMDWLWRWGPRWPLWAE
jgi:hypothetical protein